jgi:hypothetical protein
MSREIRAKVKPKAVAINTMPLWSVEVMMVRGGDCPGSRPSVSFEAMTRALQEHLKKKVIGEKEDISKL